MKNIIIKNVPTLATIKAFVKNHNDIIQIKNTAEFNGMIDMVEYDQDAEYTPLNDTIAEFPDKHNLGYGGVYIANAGRNSYELDETKTHIGYKIYNPATTFYLMIEKTADVNVIIN